MARAGPPVEEVQDRAEAAARHARPWVDAFARFGYVAKGVVYATIGLLAMLEALGMGGKTASPDGAMQSIGTQPLGGLLLVVLSAGLFGYAAWKVVQGVTDPDDRGSDAHGVVRRVCYVGSGAIHAALAYTAAQSVFGAEDSSEDAMAASVMAYQPPLGRILVTLVGIGVIGVALYQLYAAYGAKFKGELKLHRMHGAEEFGVTLAGRVGTAARALALGLAGAFVLLATYQSNPEKTRGLGGALETLQQQPLGSFMLAAVAAGLMIYGAFMFLVARHRHIDTS
ncbi:DUF1206 domain-containing protein [Rubrobacter tropicus]|uniref:DUF1206 domain-containing protein n=1 Tax=Rubrobacter tropicus TaxID=2653851 RepID=A0A6G8Q5A4_9ACTN|nr:DUF1206 domain-containing protein [Rubrobacter tropicus]QIN81646.1 DUF1206 domain-containing protein [Rubrobacter tropicus]